MTGLPKIIIVKDISIREQRRYHLFSGRVDGKVVYLALSLYGALTKELLRYQVPDVPFEETLVFVDITHEHHPSSEHPGPLAKFWSQRPICHIDEEPFRSFAEERVEEWKAAISMAAVIFSPFNESAES
jgi:hypothetical protein